MGDHRLFNYKEDLTQKISKLVVDIYIPLKKSKAGKKFAFVRFLKVDNLDRLIDNLCTIWIGRFHLHANQVRFQRATRSSSVKSTNANVGSAKNSFASVLKASNHKERLVWTSVEGLPIKTWTHNTFAKIVAPWGKLSDVEADENLDYWLRIKEHDAWALDFSNDSNDSSLSDEDYKDNDVGRSCGKQWSACNLDDEEDEFVKNTEIDHFSESSCLNIKDDVSENHVSNAQNNNLEDPFGIYNLLNRSKDKEVSKSVDLIFPPRFTPDNIEETVLDNHSNHANVNVPGCNEGTLSIKSGSIGISKLSPGGSILEVMKNLVEVGQTMRYNMEGCMKNMEAIIGSLGDFWVFK
nr:RNA-directed DNA polymerase, eukaryota, nucleotide-binding alpha-beta plait domain protein [Tanacetum cinerariifolium]